MNKRIVESLIPYAIEALNNSKIKRIDKEKKEYIDKKFRSQISSFGAAVTMGSFKAAVAFFSAQNNADIEKEQLLILMYYLHKKKNGEEKITLGEISAKDVLKNVAKADNLAQMKEDFINASIAIKLALNAFNLQ